MKAADALRIADPEVAKLVRSAEMLPQYIGNDAGDEIEYDPMRDSGPVWLKRCGVDVSRPN